MKSIQAITLLPNYSLEVVVREEIDDAFNDNTVIVPYVDAKHIIDDILIIAENISSVV